MEAGFGARRTGNPGTLNKGRPETATRKTEAGASTVNDFDWPPREPIRRGGPNDRVDPDSARDRSSVSGHAAGDDAAAATPMPLISRSRGSERRSCICPATTWHSTPSRRSPVSPTCRNPGPPPPPIDKRPRSQPGRSERIRSSPHGATRSSRSGTIRSRQSRTMRTADSRRRDRSRRRGRDQADAELCLAWQRAKARNLRVPALRRLRRVGDGCRRWRPRRPYLRRNPIDLAIIRIPVHDETTQGTIVVQPHETAPPPQNGDAALASVNERAATSGGEPPAAVRNGSQPDAPPRDARTALDAAPVTARAEIPVAEPPPAVTTNLPPPPIVVPPVPRRLRASIRRRPQPAMSRTVKEATAAKCRQRPNRCQSFQWKHRSLHPLQGTPRLAPGQRLRQTACASRTRRLESPRSPTNSGSPPC